jgi:hypothetical protein
MLTNFLLIGALTLLFFFIAFRIVVVRPKKGSHALCFGCHQKLSSLRRAMTTKPFCSRKCEQGYYDFARRSGLERLNVLSPVNEDITKSARNV